MSDLILERLDRIERFMATFAKVRGERLTRTEMCDRLRISSKTLTDRVRRGLVPSPGKDGKWLLHEVVQWESREPARDL